MSIGLGVVLFVIGAILVWALDVEVSGIDLDMVGYILMGAGALVFLIGLIFLFRRRSVATTERTGVDQVTGERVTRTERQQDEV